MPRPSTIEPSAKAASARRIRPQPAAWLPGVLLVLMTILAYQPVWQAGFLWDDERHVTDNPQLVAPDGWKQIWFSRESIQYYPMVFTTFRLERALWGLNPAPYHWLNLLLHAGSAVLLWRVLKRLRLPGAWLGAALFALHPVNVESVAWISQRKNTLTMLFYLLSALLYLRSEQKSDLAPKSSAPATQSPPTRTTHHAPRTPQRDLLHPHSSLLYFLSLLAFVLALLSKPAAAPLPFVLLGLAWWQRGRVSWREVRRCVPFFAVALVLGLVTLWFERHVNASQVVREDSLWSRLACAGWAVWFYLKKLALPLNLVPIYPRWETGAARIWSYVPGLLFLAGLVWCWRWRRGWGRPGLMSAGYYLLLLLPVVGFVNIGFMAVSLVADHWQYFAMIGPAVLVAGVWASKLGRQGPGSHAFGWRLGAVALVGLLGVLTWRQASLYANPVALWRATLAVNPGCWAVYNNLGSALVMEGQPAEAASYFREAIRLQPTYADPHNNLGSALEMMGQTDEALHQYREAIRVSPSFTAAQYNLGDALFTWGRTDEAIHFYQEALRLNPNDANIHNRLGEALRSSGQVDEATRQFEEAIRLNPGLADAHRNLGKVFAERGRVDAAMSCYQEVLRLKPHDAEAHYNLGVVLAMAGQTDAAVQQYREALRLNPHSPAACYNLGNALDQKGQSDEAIRQYQETLRLQPDHAEALHNLGVIVARRGQAAEALRCFQEALRLKPDYAAAHNSLGVALVGQGHVAEGIARFREALRLRPDFASARRNLEATLAAQAAASNRPAPAINP